MRLCNALIISGVLSIRKEVYPQNVGYTPLLRCRGQESAYMGRKTKCTSSVEDKRGLVV